MNKKYLIYLIIGIFSIVGILIFITATNSEATNPSTIVDDATVGTVAWSNPTYANSSDDIYTTVTGPSNDYTHYLKATNFGFTIPTGSTINGIKVEVELKASALVYSDNIDRIVKDGTILLHNHATSNTLPATDEYWTYGGATDLWDTTWTAEQINSIDFGFACAYFSSFGSYTASVDHIRITVYYTEGEKPSSKINIAGTNTHLKIAGSSRIRIFNQTG